jgi:hypothetical protein
MFLRAVTNPLLKGKSGLVLTLANSVVNIGAVGIANTFNVYFMRSAEAKKGITVMDPSTGESLGTSRVAASMAIKQTITARWM